MGDVGLTDEMLAGLEQAAIVRPGDTLILRLAERMTPDMAKRMGESLEERLSGVKVIFLGGVEELAVSRPEPQPAPRVELDYDRIAKGVAEAMNRALSRDQRGRRTG